MFWDACIAGNREVIEEHVLTRGITEAVFGETVMHWISMTAHVDIADWLLLHGASVHATDHHGDSPLHWACYNHQLPMAQWLVARGASVHAVNHDGFTPLHDACESSFRDTSLALVQWLVDECGADVEAVSLEGFRPVDLLPDDSPIRDVLVEVHACGLK
jgi:hypothetical protein